AVSSAARWHPPTPSSIATPITIPLKITKASRPSARLCLANAINPGSGVRLCFAWRLMPFARAHRHPLFRLRRKHVVVHPDHHRDEHDGVVEQMQLHTRK